MSTRLYWQVYKIKNLTNGPKCNYLTLGYMLYKQEKNIKIQNNITNEQGEYPPIYSILGTSMTLNPNIWREK